MRILFIGCVESSYILLKALLENKTEVVGVITKKQSSFNSDFYDLVPLCSEYGVPIHFVKNVNDEDSVEFIKNYYPDIGLCFGWSQLVKEEIIKLFPNGMVGFHPAALPNNRGRHPLIWALVLGLKETASTFFMITPGADEGDIISQKSISVLYEDDARSLYTKVMKIAAAQEIEFINELENNTLVPIKQDSSGGNSWRKRGKIDGQIDWRMSSRSIYNLVRALTRPYVGAHFVYQDVEYKVWKVEEVTPSQFGVIDNIEPGKVLSNYNGVVDVKTGDGGVIRLIDFDPVEIKEGDYIL